MGSPVQILRFISPKTAIRAALGDLGFANLMQTKEPDLIRWAVEANDFITSRRNTLKEDSVELTVADNKVYYCDDFLALDCVSIGGAPLTYKPGGGCDSAVTEGCCGVCRDNPVAFTVDECYINFIPAVEDGTKVDVKGLMRPIGEDGYPLVPEQFTFAIQEYIKWKLCFLMMDQRTESCERRWYDLCKQARATMRSWTQQDLLELGYKWWGRSRVVKPLLYGSNGHNSWIG